MKIILEKASGKSICRGTPCKKLPDYINSIGRIKSGTTCAAIKMCSAAGWTTSYYCRDCIDQLYIDMKKILDPRLWLFN